MSPGAGGAERGQAGHPGAGAGEHGQAGEPKGVHDGAPAAEKGGPARAEGAGGSKADGSRSNDMRNDTHNDTHNDMHNDTHNGGHDAGARQGEHGGHGGHLSGKQRTRFRDVIRDRHVEAIHRPDFRIGVGTVIPDHYHFYPLPPSLFEIYPEYRGFDYIIVDDEIIILEPGTRRIVDVIEE